MERIMNEFELLEKIKLSYQNIPRDNLTGIYVHGSIALGCFNWEKSDIDFVLNLCRVLAYVEADLVLSKKQGGEWAVVRVPEKYVPVIQEALECYESDREFEPRAGILKEFVEEMLRRINSRLEFTRELFVRKGYREV